MLHPLFLHLPEDLFDKYLKRRTDGEEPEDMADLFEEARKRELTKQSGNDIIDKNEIEYGVPYLEHSIHADTDYINSPEYDVKFKNITQSPAVNSTISKISKDIINHRTGTKYEDMYIINAITGEILGAQTDMKVESIIYYNESILNALDKSRKENIPIIAIHNHPEGLPPSVDDFNKAIDNNYLFGIVAGHNGQLYMYKQPEKKFSDIDKLQEEISYDIRVLGYDIDRAFKEHYNKNGIDYIILKGDE